MASDRRSGIDPRQDRFSAKLLNLGTLSTEDFVASPQGGVYLGQEGKKRYFAAYEAELEEPFTVGEGEGEGGEGAEGGGTSFRLLFRRQAERLARAIQGEEPYRSFRYPS
jgi:hypothetical protein